MNDSSDQQLLRDYAERRAEAAFTELVRRHVDLVHSAAFRMTGEAHSAKDVTQAVFVTLAQNASRLTHHPVLAGWLHTTARNLAAKNVRAAVRRQNHEQEAAAMNQLHSTAPDASWEEIAPHLDAALGELTEPERDAVMLRYFQKKSAPEMARILGVSDEAAQKRVSRAVERLREFFSKRGIAVGASGLVLITANSVQAAPVGLAVTISTAAVLTGTTLAAATTTATKAIAMTTMQKIVLTSALAAVAAVGIYEANKFFRAPDAVQTIPQPGAAGDGEMARLAEENARLSNQLAQATTRPGPASDQFVELLKLRSKAQLNAQEIAELKAALAGQTEKIPESIAAIMKKMLTASQENAKQAYRNNMTAQVKRLAQRLDLTTEQHEQVRALLLANDDAHVALEFALAIGTLTDADVVRREKLDQDEARGIAAILTPEQLTAYEKLKSAEAAANRKRWAASEAENVKQYVNLTADQTKQVNSILVELAAGAGGIGMNNYPDPRQQLELRLKAYESVLTPEQIQTYRKRKGDIIDRVQAEKAQYAKIVKALSQ